MVLLSEYPGEDEVKDQQFFTGPTGMLIKRRILDHLGIKWSEIHATNALLCWSGRKMRPGEWKKAVDSCRPRLDRELNGISNTIIAMGKRALQAVTGKAALSKMLGAPISGEDFYIGGRKKGYKAQDFTAYTVIPTFQPARMFREQWQLMPIIRSHVNCAYKIANNQISEWEWGELVLDVGEHMYERLTSIWSSDDPIAVDIETTGIDMFTDDITRIGVANQHISVSVPWCDYTETRPGPNKTRVPIGTVAGVRGGHTGIERAIKELTLDILKGDKIKVFQNGIFDRTVFRAHQIECKPPYFDTLYSHMLYSPGTDHRLDFQAAQEFHAPRWKQEFRESKEGFEK
jgi:uracil-DNA glycosylase family 4